MNRKQAREIAETITNEQIKQMFDTAKAKIIDWTKTSIVNKGITKGVAWNILAKDFDLETKHHILGKTNMVREFGEFLPDELKPKKKEKRQFTQPTHQDPRF
jgi:capsid portal protein